MPQLAAAELHNDAYHLQISVNERILTVLLFDKKMQFEVSHNPYFYQALREGDEGSIRAEWLLDATVKAAGEQIIVRGKLAGLEVEHTFSLPQARPILQEQITLRNSTPHPISLTGFACGFQRQLTDDVGRVVPDLSQDRLVAIPFRHKPTDPLEWNNDFTMEQIASQAGREAQANSKQGHGYFATLERFAEGWAWMHGGHTFGIFKFNQEAMEFSRLSVIRGSACQLFLFGGSGTMSGEPSSLRNIAPGKTIALGVTRYQTVVGDYVPAYYAFRDFLDEEHASFPKDYDPPVHWNELYDTAEWYLGRPSQPKKPRMTRPLTFTKPQILNEAAKAVAYSCEALYLDPGWDTDFATFLWGEAWLGNRREFIDQVCDEYGLKVSLHTPLATWMSMDGRGVPTWPREAWRMDQNGNLIPGDVCLGARQYLDEAAARLLDLCSDGVTFLMYDGNWWNGGCWNPSHGHPVPYTMEDHCRANLELARRVHEKYPQVLIEMHDMIAGGSYARYTPVYYKYGLPGSYDENWGFELMWRSLEDLRTGRALSLYYYNLGCNVPMYLHIDLRDDNEHCLVFWWYASVCRHLGIGGTHENPQIAEAHRLAMKRYRELDRYFKRGIFYGLGEEAHLHVLPEETGFVMNLFNLSDESRLMTVTVKMEDIGLPRDRWYIQTKGGSFNRAEGTFTVTRRLAPWSAQHAYVHALEGYTE